MKRGTEPTNPWGLTFLEFAVLEAVMDTGEHAAAAAKLGVDQRAVDNAMFRMRVKMSSENTIQQAQKWAAWQARKYQGPRTVWACRHCEGLGFTTGAPA